MAVVGLKEIARRLQKPTPDPRSLRITPLPLGSDWDDDAVDLRLGRHFFIPRGHRYPHFCPGVSVSESLYREECIPLGEFLVIPAHNTVLGATLEYIKLPIDMSGQILTKSSWARTFVTIETAPWIHPLYRGCLTLEIANVSNTPIVLYPGMKIAQLVLFHIQAETPPDKACSLECDDAVGDNVQDRIESVYMGPTRPEPAKLDGPEKALKPIGILPEQIVHPYDEVILSESHRERILGVLTKSETHREAIINILTESEIYQERIIGILKQKGYEIADPPPPD